MSECIGEGCVHDDCTHGEHGPSVSERNRIETGISVPKWSTMNRAQRREALKLARRRNR